MPDLTTEEKIKELLTDASRAFKDKDFENAIKFTTEIIELDDNHDAARYMRGFAAYTLHKYERAVEDLSCCPVNMENNPTTYIDRAIAYTLLGKPAKAEPDFNLALEKCPDNPLAWFNRGYFYTHSNRSEEALEDLNQAEKLGHKDGKLFFYRGICNFNLKRYSIATREFRKAEKLLPPEHEVHFLKGESHHTLKQFDLAIKSYDQYIYYNENGKDHNKALMKRLLSKISLKRIDDAQKDADKILVRAPEMLKCSKDGVDLPVVGIEITPDGRMDLKVDTTELDKKNKKR